MCHSCFCLHIDSLLLHIESFIHIRDIVSNQDQKPSSSHSSAALIIISSYPELEDVLKRLAASLFFYRIYSNRPLTSTWTNCEATYCLKGNKTGCQLQPWLLR